MKYLLYISIIVFLMNTLCGQDADGDASNAEAEVSNNVTVESKKTEINPFVLDTLASGYKMTRGGSITYAIGQIMAPVGLVIVLINDDLFILGLSLEIAALAAAVAGPAVACAGATRAYNISLAQGIRLRKPQGWIYYAGGWVSALLGLVPLSPVQVVGGLMNFGFWLTACVRSVQYTRDNAIPTYRKKFAFHLSPDIRFALDGDRFAGVNAGLSF